MQQCAPSWRSATRWWAMAALVLCLWAVAGGSVVESESGTGAITGRVTLSRKMRGVPIPTNAYASRSVTRQTPPPSPEMRSVVLYLTDAKAREPLPTMQATIRQENETFFPRVLAITRGSTVAFPNFDPYFHNVFSLSNAATFDLGRFQTGQSKSRQFTKPGVVKVYCHLHSQMSATIVVLDHPFFATPDVNGLFTIEGIPPGSYTLVGWHERVGEQKEQVRVEAGRTVTADVSLPVEDGQ